MMSKKLSRRVIFSPDITEPSTVPHNYAGGGNKVGGNRKMVMGILSFRLPKSLGFSAVRFLKPVGLKVARAMHCVSTRKGSSRRVSSLSLAKSRSRAEAIDCHRAEAVKDCIEFLNSSSTLKRSSSVSTRARDSGTF